MAVAAKPAAKSAAKSAAKPAAKPITSADKVEVKNVTRRAIPLTHGTIAPGKTGTATVAELSCLFTRLEKA